MKLTVSKESFKNQQGEVIEYNAFVCHGAINGLAFKVYVKPYDLTGKQVLRDFFDKGDLVVKDYQDKNGVEYSKAFFEFNNVSIPVIVEKDGIFIIKLYDLLSKSGK